MLPLAIAFLGLAFVSDLYSGPVRIATRTWRIGRYIVRRELWSEMCLECGIGPWSIEGGETESIPGANELEERLRVYQEEFELRCEELPPYDVDAPPPGSTKLVASEWIPLKAPVGDSGYDAVQIQVWDTQ